MSATGVNLMTVEQIGDALKTLSASVTEIAEGQKKAYGRLDEVEKNVAAAVEVQSGSADTQASRDGIASMMSAVLQAAREDDPAKREAAIRQAMFHGDKDKEAGTLRDDKEKKEASQKVASMEAAIKQQGEVIKIQQAKMAEPPPRLSVGRIRVRGGIAGHGQGEKGGMGLDDTAATGGRGRGHAPVRQRSRAADGKHVRICGGWRTAVGGLRAGRAWPTAQSRPTCRFH